MVSENRTIFYDELFGCRLYRLYVDRKSTSWTCQFLGNCLVSWSSKKQNSIALSTAEAEYVAAGACCAQVLWMKHTLLDCDLHYNHIKIFCDNTSTIHMTKNTNQHSKTKHIEIRYHFLRDHSENGDCLLYTSPSPRDRQKSRMPSSA